MSASTATTATIAVLDGDGIGPEVTQAARVVLEGVAARFGHTFVFVDALIGGAAIDAVGRPLPDATLTACSNADAVLLGAVGGPQWDVPNAAMRPEQGLLALRRALGLFANLRPVVPHARFAAMSPLKESVTAGVDLLVVRELTGGIYFGEKTRARTATGERASDLCTYTSEEIERIVRTAGGLARQRRGRVTSVDKANVLETSRLWRSVTARVMAEEFPEIAIEHVLVDACAMQLIQRPTRFDVIVTENMFGDILTDEAAVIAGSIGVLPSASLGAPASGRQRGLYEPIHGSAPALAGRGVANPIGAILSAAMLLRYSLRLEKEALAVEQAVSATAEAGVLTEDLTPHSGASSSTEEVVQHIVSALGAMQPT